MCGSSVSHFLSEKRNERFIAYISKIASFSISAITSHLKMDLQNVSKVSALSGYNLNIEESSGLEVAILQRKREESLTGRLAFWGKIFGVTQDYLIVVLIDSSDEFPSKKYYYWLRPKKISKDK